jgi:uncharacterized protein YceH (UPF0502 family)
MDEVTGSVVKEFPGEALPRIVLSDVEARVLGSLVEKQLTTPDNYPLTLNALTLACNQLSNREPVVSYDEVTVVRALNRLRELKLAFAYSGAESRATRYGHKLEDVCSLAPAELAAVTVLLLRGPQTLGEIRGRTGRMHTFATLEEADATLQALATRMPQPFVAKLPRQPGAKESRYAHLLSGEVAQAPVAASPAPEPATVVVQQENERIAKLEQEVAVLRQDVTEMRTQLAEFRKQFE